VAAAPLSRSRLRLVIRASDLREDRSFVRPGECRGLKKGSPLRGHVAGSTDSKGASNIRAKLASMWACGRAPANAVRFQCFQHIPTSIPI